MTALLIRAARGAVTLDDDAPETMEREVIALFSELLAQNGIATEDLLYVFLTVTPDLRKANPAKFVRQHFHWRDVPLMCAQEADIEGYPPRCVRAMIQFYTTRARDAVRHVYLGGAAALRPDCAH